MSARVYASALTHMYLCRSEVNVRHLYHSPPYFLQGLSLIGLKLIDCLDLLNNKLCASMPFFHHP